jgi:hypothetical protein
MDNKNDEKSSSTSSSEAHLLTNNKSHPESLNQIQVIEYLFFSYFL